MSRFTDSLLARRANTGRSRLRAFGLAVVAGMSLSACADDPFVERNTPFMSVQERHPIRLVEEPEYLEVAVGPGSSRLTAAQKNQVAAFIAQYKARAQGDLFVRMPSGTKNEGAARHALEDIRTVVAQQGISSRSVRYKPYREKSLGAYPPIVLGYKGLSAVADECGNWPTNISTNPNNVAYDDFGCSSQRNLAAMVANPLDLEQPRQVDPVSAARRDTVYKAYVKGERTAAVPQDAGSNLSGVGQ